MAEDDPVKIPIDGVLDLHAFSPKDVKDLVPEYLRECRSQGIYHVRIIHGKGAGILRKIVHSILEKDPHVLHFKTAHYRGGSWGATEVELKEDRIMPVHTIVAEASFNRLRFLLTIE